MNGCCCNNENIFYLMKYYNFAIITVNYYTKRKIIVTIFALEKNQHKADMILLVDLIGK